MKRDRPRRNRGGFIGVALAVLPLLYVLSSGPLPLLAARCDIAMDSATARPLVRGIYAPLYWLHDETLLEAPLHWYWVKWWFLFGSPMYCGVHGGVI